MLTRVDVDAFRGRTGSTVQLFAVERNNGGTEFVTYTYAGQDLDPLEIDGHPGCEFTVLAGREVFRCVATPGNPAGFYDLFERLDDGSTVDLEEEINLTFGPIHQFFIIGTSTTKKAAKAPKFAKTAAKKAAKKPVAKKQAAKKSVAKKAAKRVVAKKPAGTRKSPKRSRR
jgi:hypothetical protein